MNYPASETALCAYGSDLGDCGYRACCPVSGPCEAGRAAASRRLQFTDGGLFDVGWVEVYVSRHLALFGTRCATLNTTATVDSRTMLRCTEGQGNAAGRFVYLRSFESARMLRVDGMRVYRAASNRRLQQDYDERLLGATTPESLHTTDSEAKAESAKLLDAHMKNRSINMLNLTKSICSDRKRNPERALRARREAAILWAELGEEYEKSCYDCVTLRVVNCTAWFVNPFGLHNDIGEHGEHTRRLKAGLEEQQHERRRKLEDGVSKACCRRNKRTGETDCKREYCERVFAQQAQVRMGHILRRMHEKGHIEMSVDQRVAVDVIAPHLHSDPRCRAQDPHSRRVDKHVSDVECIASSLVNHMSEKHGLSTDSIDAELAKYGLSVAKMIAQPFRVASTATETVSNFRSNPAFADMAAKLRAKQVGAKETSGRRSLQPAGKTRPRRLNTKDARAPRWRGGLKGRPTKLRHDTHEWLRNASHFASRVHRAESLRQASAATPHVHSLQPVSYLETAKETMATIVSADGSVVGTAMNSARAVSNLASDGYELMKRVRDRAQENESRPRQRRLSESSIADFFEQVEVRLEANMANMGTTEGRRLSVADAGLTLPTRHVSNNGWVAGAIDWKQAVTDTHDVAVRLLKRRDDMLEHVERNGELPSGPLQEEHKTGIKLLDMNVPPSKLGNMFRQLHAWATNRHASTAVRNYHARRMEEARHVPRPENKGRHESVLASALESSVIGDDPLTAVWNTLESSNHHRTSRARKLAESILGAAASVPLLATSVGNKYSRYDETEGGYNFFKEMTRYVVYGTHDPCMRAHTPAP